MPLLSIQYLRALAALVVVLYHCVTVMNPNSTLVALDVGKYGVDLFFVISGFIMVFTWKPSISSFEFLWRRILRIVPLYWLMTVIVVVLALLYPTAFSSTKPDLERLVLSLFFIPHYHRVLTDLIMPILNPGWTLVFEMYFYLIFAATLFLKNRAFYFCGLVLLSLVVIGKLLVPSGALAITLTSPLVLEFVLGMVVAKYFKALPSKRVFFSWIFACTVFGLIAGSFFFVDFHRPATAGVISAAIIFFAIAAERNGWINYKSGVVSLMGDASYSIYLTHLFVLGAIRVAFKKFEIWSFPVAIDIVLVIVATLMAFGVGLLVHLVVEKPLNEMLRRKRPKALHAGTF